MKRSVVVVLGMHRSGTSAITRGLQVLGVELGDRLMPPLAENNEKGFFEDLDIVAINIEIYEMLGQHQDWHTLAFVPGDELLSEKYAPLKSRAIEQLNSKMQDVDCFGLKDPRICRLLPFWQDVFEQMQLDVSYVIALRNPISVAKSLEKRDKLPPEKCHYLWLEHVVPSVLLTQGARRVVVEYDRILSDPGKQIGRIARALDFAGRIDEARLAEFEAFLEDRLRHETFSLSDTLSDPVVPTPVKTAFRILQQVATDSLTLDSKFVTTSFKALSEQMEGMAQAMNYLLGLENTVALAYHDLMERDGRIEMLLQAAKEHESRMTALSQVVHEKDLQISKTAYEAAERDNQIKALIQAARGYEDQVATLSQMIHDKDTKIWDLDRAVAECTREMIVTQDSISKLKHTLAERVEQVGALQEVLKEKEAIIEHVQTAAVQINHRLHQAHASLGWRLFRPLRLIRALLARLQHTVGVDLAPLSQIQADGRGWRATGEDPQLLLIAERNWQGLAGWCWLEADSTAARRMHAQLCFNLGKGFDETRVIEFQLSGKGPQRIPLYVPSKCHAIRLTPCDSPLRFELAITGIRRLAEAPEMPPEFLSQFAVFEALGGRPGSAAALEPAGGVLPDEGGEYEWRTEAADPRFLVKRASQKLRPGWHMVELLMRSDPARGNAKLYFDNGDGYSEADCVALPFDEGQPVERLFHVATAPKQVRFDPVEAPGKFSVERLYFAPAGPIFARNSMLRRLSTHSDYYKGRPVGVVWRDLQAAARTREISPGEFLLQRYNETFPAYGPHDAVSYEEWIKRVETPEFSDTAAIEAAQRAFTHQPTISVVMPVYNTAAAFLRRAIESVVGQSYPLWELCIADDASTQPHVRAILEEYARNDHRIKVTFRTENGHISAASNSALSLATGEYVALLDHDDELAPHALHFMVQAINRTRFGQIFYSDEDKINEKGEREEPHYKPDWNPDLFLSQNYISHLAVYRRDLVERVGGFRAGVEGSQDHDLLLRCLPHVKPAGIVHIPKVLYHWRRLEGSTAYDSAEKIYATDAGIRALEEYFRTLGRGDVKVESGLVPNTYRVRYPLPQPEPLVSLLIPTRDKVELLEVCVRSILEKTTYRNFEITIIDNGSTDRATLDYFTRIQAEEARVRVVPYTYPFNFPAINNFGVRHARGEVVGLVNNDIEVISPEWLTEMVSHALRPDIGCVGAKLFFADETIQHAGVITGLGGVAGHSHKYFPRAASGYFHRLKIIQNLSAVTAACLVVRKTVYEQVGGMDEAALGIAFNDVDFCLKVREAGYRNLWTPYAELYHYESKSRGAEDTPEKVERFNKEVDFMKAKWGGMLRSDPCYSRNLTLTREDFSLGGG